VIISAIYPFGCVFRVAAQKTGSLPFSPIAFESLVNDRKHANSPALYQALVLKSFILLVVVIHAASHSVVLS
jgi:hypothetical protein